MSIIFLDFDGVLINRQSWLMASGSHAMAHRPCVDALNRIIEATEASIVVSSTSRIGKSAMELHFILKGWGVQGRVLGKTPQITTGRGKVLVSRPRGEEIERWLDAEGWDEPFVILDDEGIAGVLESRLVRTDFEIGLTMEDATRAIRLLQSANAGTLQPAIKRSEERQKQELEVRE